MEAVCAGCAATEDINSAVDGGEWVPSYWDEASGSEVDGPFCPACVKSRGVVFDIDFGDYLRPLIT
jgi:hypothetical protein